MGCKYTNEINKCNEKHEKSHKKEKMEVRREKLQVVRRWKVESGSRIAGFSRKS